MKKIFITLIAILISVHILGQTEVKKSKAANGTDELQTLFNNTGPVGWWVSPDFAYTKIESKDAFLGGISGGIIINHSFSIGLAGYGILTSEDLKFSGINDTADLYLYGGYGGLKLEYRINSLKLVNVAFPLLIGGGGVSYTTWGPQDMYNYNSNYDYSSYAWDSFFVIEPGVVVGVNLLKFMRLDAGVSYRYAPGLKLPETSSTLLNGFNANFSLKFGRF